MLLYYGLCYADYILYHINHIMSYYIALYYIILHWIVLFYIALCMYSNREITHS